MFLWEKLKAIRLKLLAPVIAEIKSSQVEIELRLQNMQTSLGRVEFRQLNHETSYKLVDHEYQVFSQWKEDGIIQFLVRNICIETKIFVEFGVEDYTECNTRFLLINNNWSGLVIDSSQENISQLKKSSYYWNYNLKAVQSFVTKDNINNLLVENGVSGEIGLLSIDIDGNDYWIWEAINVVSPVIVIVEYNHRFGSDLAVTIPYKENFERSKEHHSMIYFGASLKALCILAKLKGYAFIGCNSNGVNAFFIRKDKKPDAIKELSPEEGYREGQFCELRDQKGVTTKTSPKNEKLLLKNLNLPVVNIEAIE